jgi:hypothetical protein
VAEYTRAELDAMTDKAAETIREGTLSGLKAQYADTVAEALAVQFPGIPELPRIALACAQHMSALAAERVPTVTIIHILGAAALRLEDKEADRG